VCVLLGTRFQIDLPAVLRVLFHSSYLVLQYILFTHRFFVLLATG